MAFIKMMAIGNVGKDPIISTLPSGATVANFSIASTEKWKDKNTGEPKEHTEWLRCSVVGALADVVAQYVKQGSKLYLEGKYKTSKYMKGDVEVTGTELRFDQMEMLDGPKGKQEQSQQGGYQQQQQNTGYQQQPQQQQNNGYQHQPQQQQNNGYQQQQPQQQQNTGYQQQKPQQQQGGYQQKPQQQQGGYQQNRR